MTKQTLIEDCEMEQIEEKSHPTRVIDQNEDIEMILAHESDENEADVNIIPSPTISQGQDGKKQSIDEDALSFQNEQDTMCTNT